MVAEINTPPVTEFEFTREEQWAMHQAFLDYIHVAVRDDTDLPLPSVELTIIEKIEDKKFAFTAFELDRIQYECDYHARSEFAPEIDRKPAQSVIEKIDQQSLTAGEQ
ncbi:DUF7853 family protein [Halocatena marina]|uniref:Uncharacterized protein n=1 Tax=Halocatena marina TaxID=2934937 RepID=A0ABD5YSA2_9EURY|nr:hypothetical protein [Halocatena marina]